MLKWKLRAIVWPIRQVSNALRSLPALAFLPAASLAAYWVLGEAALLALSIGLPAICLGVVLLPPLETEQVRLRTNPAVLGGVEELRLAIGDGPDLGAAFAACFVIRLEPFDEGALALVPVAQRVLKAVRGRDCVVRLGADTLGVYSQFEGSCDIDHAYGYADRIMAVVESPLVLAGEYHRVSCTIGFCTTLHFEKGDKGDLLTAARSAQVRARKLGAGAIKCYESVRENGRKNAGTPQELPDFST